MIILLFTQLQIWQVYADYKNKLETHKEKSIEALDKVEVVIDNVVEKLDKKINNEQKEERLKQKQEEIKQYLEETKEEIEEENSTSDIKEKLIETKKVVVLKVVSWVTKYENIEDNIPEEVAETKEEKKQALETIQNSLEEKNWNYTLIIKTKYDRIKVQTLLYKFDPKAKVNFMYSQNKTNYFEITINKNSLFSQEMLEDIEAWILPETFLWIEIVQPEVFSIWNLEWEEISKTWWIEKYKTYEYFDEIKSSKVKVWVIDTWIDYTHLDLKSNTSQIYDMTL